MKKLFVMLMIAVLALAVCTGALAEETDGMPNPWVEATAEDIVAAVGVAFGVPEGAEDVQYYILQTENLAEMDFTWYGMEYCARILCTDAWEDTSGMYYETWEQSMDVEIGGCPGVEMRTPDGDVTVNLCMWYDADAGRMYSLSTGGENLDGFDITAAAEAIYASAVQ